MKHYYKIIFGALLAIWFFSTAESYAQEAKPDSVVIRKVDEKKVKKILKQADKKFFYRDMVKASEYYAHALQVDDQNFYAAFRLGRCLWYMGYPDSARRFYDDAVRMNPNGNDTVYFLLANALKEIGSYDEAKTTYHEFMRRSETKGEKGEFYEQAQRSIQGCDDAIELMKKEPEYMIDNISYNSFIPTEEKEILNKINIQHDDLSPWFWTTKTDSFLIFTSYRQGNKGNKKYMYDGQKFSDLWIVKMESDSTYGEPENLGSRLNTKANDGQAVVDPSGAIMYYTICGGGKIKKFHGCSIYMSEYNEEAKKWSKFRKVEGVNGTRLEVVKDNGKTKKVPTYDAQPFLTEDGNTMYFISDREGGLGATDIWYSQKSGTSWGPPVNAGPVINTPFNETFPRMGKDGKTLYFASDGHKGLGGYDIFKTEGQLNTWAQPNHLNYPVNTSFDDYNVMWFFQDSIGLISSNRKMEMGSKGKIDSRGRDDIWRIKKLPACKEIKLTVHGRVRDKDEKQVIPFATVTLFKMLDQKMIPIDTFKTAQNAYYELPLERNTEYKIVANAPEYLANEVFVSTKDLPKCKDTELEADVDIFLQDIEIDKPIVLQNIYYDFDKWDLRPESKSELEKLVKLMTENPTIVIQIGSHTDTNGTEPYNIKLSDRRAKSVVDYLRDKGIPRARLSAFGFGESTPMVYPELSDSDEQSNRRTEFRIKSMDYQSK